MSDSIEPGLVTREVIHRGRIVRLSLDTVRFPDGESGVLEMVEHPGAALVVPFVDPLTADDPRILMLRQYRYAAGGLLLEVPAGMPGTDEESWEACAARELVEETGRTAGHLRYLTRIHTTPGFTNEVIHLFAATELGEGVARPDDDEYLEVIVVRFGDALQRIRHGEITDAKSIAALLYLATFPEVWEETRAAPPR